MLRASTEQTGDELDYNAVTGGVAAGDTGIPHGALLIEFAEAVIDTDETRLAAARQAIAGAMGSDAVVDSAGVAALFNAIDRVADSTGAPLEDWKLDQTADLRAAIGINAFAATKAAIEESRSEDAAE